MLDENAARVIQLRATAVPQHTDPVRAWAEQRGITLSDTPGLVPTPKPTGNCEVCGNKLHGGREKRRGTRGGCHEMQTLRQRERR